jgi:hypothetical protein
MYVQWLGGMLGYSPDHRHPIRDVGDKNTVHHINMMPVGRASVNEFHIALQIPEIGCQQGRGYFNYTHVRIKLKILCKSNEMPPVICRPGKIVPNRASYGLSNTGNCIYPGFWYIRSIDKARQLTSLWVTLV